MVGEDSGEDREWALWICGMHLVQVWGTENAKPRPVEEYSWWLQETRRKPGAGTKIKDVVKEAGMVGGVDFVGGARRSLEEFSFLLWGRWEES